MTPLNPSYRVISLTRGQFALIDEKDFKLVSQFKWRAEWSSKIHSYYAVVQNQRLPRIAMHRLIMGLERGDPRQVDHIDPSRTLDNRRFNLRICTSGQNRANSRLGRNNTSGFKGVRKEGNGWVATIKANSKIKYLGWFSDPKQANDAYAIAAREAFGEFARP